MREYPPDGSQSSNTHPWSLSDQQKELEPKTPFSVESLRWELVRRGSDWLDNVEISNALLHDLYPGYQKERNVLLAAVSEGVAKDLAQASAQSVSAEFLSLLASRLEANTGSTPEACCWAVETWALALRKFPHHEKAPGTRQLLPATTILQDGIPSEQSQTEKDQYPTEQDSFITDEVSYSTPTQSEGLQRQPLSTQIGVGILLMILSGASGFAVGYWKQDVVRQAQENALRQQYDEALRTVQKADLQIAALQRQQEQTAQSAQVAPEQTEELKQQLAEANQKAQEKVAEAEAFQQQQEVLAQQLAEAQAKLTQAEALRQQAVQELRVAQQERVKGTTEVRRVPREAQLPIGQYRVVTAGARLRESPYKDAPVIIRFRIGQKIQVTEVRDGYLRVESNNGNDPGYLSEKDAAPVRRK